VHIRSAFTFTGYWAGYYVTDVMCTVGPYTDVMLTLLGCGHIRVLTGRRDGGRWPLRSRSRLPSMIVAARAPEGALSVGAVAVLKLTLNVCWLELAETVVETTLTFTMVLTFTSFIVRAFSFVFSKAEGSSKVNLGFLRIQVGILGLFFAVTVIIFAEAEFAALPLGAEG